MASKNSNFLFFIFFFPLLLLPNYTWHFQRKADNTRKWSFLLFLRIALTRTVLSFDLVFVALIVLLLLSSCSRKSSRFFWNGILKNSTDKNSKSNGNIFFLYTSHWLNFYVHASLTYPYRYYLQIRILKIWSGRPSIYNEILLLCDFNVKTLIFNVYFETLFLVWWFYID